MKRGKEERREMKVQTTSPRRQMAVRVISVIFILLSFLLSSSSAEITGQGTGMLFGADHAFFFTAPQGWVLDNESAVKQGLHMVFYPVGYTWSNSPVIAYGRKVSKNETVRSIQDQVEATLKEFHEKGSPNYKAAQGGMLTVPQGKQAHIYYYEGDQWGNYEAAGYIEEKNTINFVVFNSRTKADFEKYLPAFKQLVATYWSAGSSQPVDDRAFKELVREAKQMSKTPDGKDYERTVIQRAGNTVATFMRACSSYVGDSEVRPFEAIFRIKPDGTISEAFVKPDTALSTCFEGLFLHTKHPAHRFDSYLLHIDMRIK